MSPLHSIISLLLIISLFFVCAIGLNTMYKFARSAPDRRTKRLWYLMAIVWGGLMGVEAHGLLFDTMVSLGFVDRFLRVHLIMSPYEDTLLIFLNLATIVMIVEFRHGALEGLANAFREIQQLRREVMVDRLTGLLNRNAMARLHDQCTWSSWAALMIDVDDFKVFNDTHGHQAGDQALAGVGRCIQQSVRESDFAFRYGGEEFLLVCPGITLEQSLQVTQRLQESLSHLSIPLTVSVGITQGTSAKSLEESIGEADAALYKAKGQGKNQVVVWSPGLEVRHCSLPTEEQAAQIE